MAGMPDEPNLLNHEVMLGPHENENLTNSHLVVQRTEQLFMFIPFCFRYTGGILSHAILEPVFGIE